MLEVVIRVWPAASITRAPRLWLPRSAFLTVARVSAPFAISLPSSVIMIRWPGLSGGERLSATLKSPVLLRSP